MNKNLKIGVALGAGAARGLAHIGVLEILKEHDVPIDLIAGCSMGAVIACMYASGTSPKEIHNFISKTFSNGYGKLIDVTLPRMGLIKGNNIDTIITALTGDVNMDEMKIPFATISTCLEDGKIKVFDSGKATEAVRASISLPGVFEPVIIDGRTYVDGGVLVRVPVEVVRSMGADIVISVDVGYRGELRSSPENIVDIMIYSFELQQWAAMRDLDTDADITIAVDTSSISPTEFVKVEESVAVGRAAALAMIDKISDLIEVTSPNYWARITRKLFNNK